MKLIRTQWEELAFMAGFWTGALAAALVFTIVASIVVRALV